MAYSMEEVVKILSPFSYNNNTTVATYGPISGIYCNDNIKYECFEEIYKSVILASKKTRIKKMSAKITFIKLKSIVTNVA